MLQDVESGREPEIDALLGSVIELGQITDTPTPALDAVYACVKLLARVLAQHEAAVRLGARDAASPRAVASSDARMPISE
jgi:2-dehydropantoate 2-reductase